MKKITILLFAAAALGVGCKKFIDINRNPNQPTSVTPNVLLSAALTSSASSAGGDLLNETARWMGYFSRSGNYIAQNTVEDYQLAPSYGDGSWQDMYLTLGRWNNVELAGKASPSTLAFYIGAAKTMKAFHFGNLVDVWNDCPYSQAFNITKNITPSYDKAATIYADLIAQLDSAVTLFNTAAAYYGSGGSNTIDNQYDILYGKNGTTSAATRIAEWTAFANTLKLKLLMNEINVNTDPSAEIAKSVANGGFMMPGQGALVNPGYSTANQAQVNPFYGIFYTNAGSPTSSQNFFRANNYALNFYAGKLQDGTANAHGTQDSYRPQLVYQPVSGTTVGGNYDGDPAALANTFTSGVGTGIAGSATASQPIMTDFEGLFIQAEAAARGYSVGNDAATLLKEAIEQSFIYLGDNAADADTYIAAGATNADPNLDYATGGLQAVLTQKWIALNCINWLAAYTDFRRSGYPNSNVLGVTHGVQPTKNNGKVEIPFRLLYPQSEIDANGKNVPSLANGPWTPIFWNPSEN